ncbi:TAXI family TRAP transporter solute-binding subunit [Rhodocyclaceae bacterium SMB388]
MFRSLHIFQRMATRQALFVGLFALVFALPAIAQDRIDSPFRIVTFGSGPLGGAYYEAAKSICAEFNVDAAGMQRCSPDPTPGSLYNLAALRRGDLDFAIVQSDLQRDAVYTERFSLRGAGGGALSSVISLYSEAFTILARQEAQVRDLEDLRGLRVDRGPLNSGRRPTVERLFAALGLSETDFEELSGITTSVALDELCDGRLDAVILVIGHPNAAVARTLENCEVDVVGATGPAIRDFLSENPVFIPGTIPSSAYPDLDEDVPTFSVLATVLTRNDVPDALVSAFTRSLLDMRNSLPQAGPADTGGQWWAGGLTAPLHPAARGVFEERGLALPPPPGQ